MAVRVLGVDPGLSRCGYGVIDHGCGPTLVSCGTVETRGDDVARRLAELAGRLREVLRATRPDVVAVERLFFNANVRTALQVGQASGVALLVAAEAGVEVFSYTPSQVKRAVTGNGAAPKEQVAYMVCALLKLVAAPRPVDTTDALAVALCHGQHARLGPGLRAEASSKSRREEMPEGWAARVVSASPALARGSAGLPAPRARRRDGGARS